MKNLSSLFTVVAFIFASCNSGSNEKVSAETSTTPAFDLSKARTYIEGVNAKFGEEIKKGDSTGMASHYSSDAWCMPPNEEPVKGTKEITAAWGAAIRAGIRGLKITTQDVAGDAGMLAETGSYEMYDASNNLFQKGKYVVSWKSENGEWKLYRDIWSPNSTAGK